jgi:MFS family permease
MKFSTKTKSLLYSFEFSHGVRRSFIGGLALIYFLSFGFNVIAVTTLFAVSTLIMTFFEFPTGAIADYDSRKKSIMISFLLITVAFFGLFIFKSFWLLAGAWILGDIAWAFYSGSGSAWSIDALKIGKKKNKIVSLVSKGNFFEKGGHVIGGLIGLVIIAINFSLVWLFVSLLYFFMFFITWRYMEERNFKPEKVPHNYLMKSLIKAKESFNFIIHKKNQQLRMLLIGNFVGVLSIGSFLIAFPLFFTQILNLNPEHLSGILALVAGLTIISPLIAEKILHKKGIRGILVFSSLVLAVFSIFFGLSTSIILAIVFFIILNIFASIMDVAEESAYHHEFDSKIRASLGSFSNIVWAVAFSISVFLAGISITFFGIFITIILGACLALVEAGIYFFGLKKD